MKVEELSGNLLDYWVGRAEGKTVEIRGGLCMFGDEWFSPTKKWSQGGPIIEREEIQLVPRANGEQWAAGIDQCVTGGDTVLIAAMRCYVASKFGDEVPDAE